jgi:hypothetical protein
MFLFPPSGFFLPPILSRNPLKLDTVQYPTKPLIGFEDTEVINAIASCEVEENEREKHLFIRPTLGLCMKMSGDAFSQVQDNGQIQIDGKACIRGHAAYTFFFFILVREDSLWHTCFTSLVMDFVQQHYSITLITRQQRGFALFLMVDWGSAVKGAAMNNRCEDHVYGIL